MWLLIPYGNARLIGVVALMGQKKGNPVTGVLIVVISVERLIAGYIIRTAERGAASVEIALKRISCLLRGKDLVLKGNLHRTQWSYIPDHLKSY
jgi:hypothetical protein